MFFMSVIVARLAGRWSTVWESGDCSLFVLDSLFIVGSLFVLGSLFALGGVQRAFLGLSACSH